MSTVVDRLYTEYSELVDHLSTGGQFSFANTANEVFQKTLVLTAASYFEHCITFAIEEWTGEVANTNTQIIYFVRNKAISRQYHTFFNWDGNNANSFFGLFGEDFKSAMQRSVKSDEQLDRAIRSFLEIGLERNRLVHNDFGAYSMEKSPEEIYAMYKLALAFVHGIPGYLRLTLDVPADD